MTISTPIYRRIPVVHEALADLDTPLSVYLKLAKGPYSYLLESAQGGEKWGRYSIVGLPARTIVKVNKERVQIITDGAVVEEAEEGAPRPQGDARRRVPQVCAPAAQGAAVLHPRRRLQLSPFYLC